MRYRKEISELWKERKKSTNKYEEAIEDGYDVDADMWAHDVMEIERQIYVYEQASRADEYEAKAKAFGAILKSYEESISEGHLADDVCNIIEKYKNQMEELK